MSSRWRTTVILGALSLLAGPLLAQQGASPLSGSVSLGARNVDTTGAYSKYRQDVNLDDGVRVLDVAIGYEAPAGGDGIDYIDITASNLGGDPFESIRADIRKFGSYRLKLERHRSGYFYDDTILPDPLADVAASTGGDFHRFDFVRVRESADLDITVSPTTDVSVGIERQTRRGDSETTRDIQRDEFELLQPLDESSNAVRLGVQHRWQRVKLIYEEESRSFDNASALLLPGASPGRSTTDLADLQFFMLDKSYDYDSRVHMLRTIVNATERLEIGAFASREDLALDMRASESSSGTDFAGAPFATSASGPAHVNRGVDLNGIDVGYSIGTRARVIASLRSTTLDQRGAVRFGTDAGNSDWSIETQGFELGAEYAFGPRLIVAAGWSDESRDTAYARTLNGDVGGQRQATGRGGLFMRLRYGTPNGLSLSVAVEDNSIDDPFALASPTDARRYKMSLHRDWETGLSLDANLRHTAIDNNDSGWGTDTDQADVRLGYRTESFRIGAGLGEIDAARRIDQLVTGGTIQVPFAIDYQSDASFSDLSAQWMPGQRLSVGGNLRRYENRGSFPIDRDDWRAFLHIKIAADYAIEVDYRSIDYVEDSFDDYAADILEVAVQLNF
jgi:hypothetical protein